MEEHLDEVDREGNVIATHPKSHFKERMFLHKASLVLLRAKKGKIFLSQNPTDRYYHPGKWYCSLGGKALSGETDEEAAVREMKEEIGKTFPIKKITSFVYDTDEYKSIFSIFITTTPVSPNELSLDPNEIQSMKAFTISEILEGITKHPENYVPTAIAALKEFAKHYKE